MPEERPLPDIDRMSTLAALLLLVFTLARVIELPSLEYELAFINILIPLRLNTRLIMLLLATVISIVGADWLVQSHPEAPSGRRVIERWILPGLTALGIGSLLTRLPEGWALWLGLVLTSALLLAVFLAEYLTISHDDPRRDLAVVGLEILAYVLIFGTAFGFRVVDLRLVFVIPTAFVASMTVAWRLFRLQHPSIRSLAHAAVVGWGFSQLAVGFHYWPMPPVRGSLLLVLFFYFEITAVGDVLRARLARARVLELGLLGLLGSALIVAMT